MNLNSHNKTPEQMTEAIFALDLAPIKTKLMDKKEGHGWSRVQADRYELGYKRFLTLLVKFPDEVIAPDANADKFWHGHILDTMKYAEDCDTIFGCFLHHFPYFGMRGAEDAANLANAAATMHRLYQQEFGDAGAATAYCGAASVSYCGASAGKADQATAYCGASADKAHQATAYCGAASVSYCGAVSGNAVGKPGQATAYCGAAIKS